MLSATDATSRSSSSGSYVTASNTLSVTITPSSASNKILILLSTTVAIADTTYVTIFRGATNIGSANGFARCPITQNIGINYLDSPATTSATTYQLYFKVDTVNTTTIQPNSITGSITCLEIKG